jgi:transcriptional regulator with XRE-family HTH domain
MARICVPVNDKGTNLLTIGERLKEERLRLGMNQPDFAGIGGVGKNTQINYEKDERSPDADYLAEIGKAGVDLMYVLTGQRSLAVAEGLAPDETALLERYRTLTDEDRQTLDRVSLGLVKLNEKTQK